MLVGPPSCGKGEVLGPVSQLPDVYPTATLTEAALLSGSSQADGMPTGTGGLLRELGNFGIVLFKDFTSVLSMHRDKRAEVLAALREIYDGSWTRRLGVDGGRTLSWSGKVGMLAGCTPVIDQHHAVSSSMGERFLMYRFEPVDGLKQADSALKRAGRDDKMRETLNRVVKELFDSITLPKRIPPLNPKMRRRFSALAALAARCRSPVERDNYRRDIVSVPPPESPARIGGALYRLYSGMRVIGVSPKEAWRVTSRVALDCMPAARRPVFDALVGSDSRVLSLSDIVAKTRLPEGTARRSLEDFVAHRVIIRVTAGQGTKGAWMLSNETREQIGLARLR